MASAIPFGATPPALLNLCLACCHLRVTCVVPSSRFCAAADLNLLLLAHRMIAIYSITLLCSLGSAVLAAPVQSNPTPPENPRHPGTSKEQPIEGLKRKAMQSDSGVAPAVKQLVERGSTKGSVDSM